MAATDLDKTYVDQFRLYYSGEMSDKDQHQFEVRLMNEPLFADAYDGYLTLLDDHVDAKKAFVDLNQQMKGRLTEKQNQILPVWAYAAAASAVFLIGWLVSASYERSETHEVSVHQSPATKQTIESITDSLIAAEPLRAKADQAANDKPENLPAKSDGGKPKEQKGLENKLDRIADNAVITEITDSHADSFVLSQAAVQSATDFDSRQNIPSRPLAAPASSAPASLNLKRPFVAAKKNEFSLVQGRVVDENGRGLPGANVFLSENKGVETDSNGIFKIEVTQQDSLKIAFIGYTPILLSADKADLGIIKLEEEHLALTEVLATGYGKARAKKMPVIGTKADTTPRPSSGWENFQLYITQKRFNSMKGTVLVKFKVNNDGTLSDFSAKGEASLRERAIILIRKGPAWIPAVKNSIDINEFVTVTVVFGD